MPATSIRQRIDFRCVHWAHLGPINYVWWHLSARKEKERESFSSLASIIPHHTAWSIHFYRFNLIDLKKKWKFVLRGRCILVVNQKKWKAWRIDNGRRAHTADVLSLWLTPLLHILHTRAHTHILAIIIRCTTYASGFRFFFCLSSLSSIWFGVNRWIEFHFSEVTFFNALQKYLGNIIKMTSVPWMASPECSLCCVVRSIHAAFNTKSMRTRESGQSDDEWISFVDGDLWLTLWQKDCRIESTIAAKPYISCRLLPLPRMCDSMNDKGSYFLLEKLTTKKKMNVFFHLSWVVRGLVDLLWMDMRAPHMVHLWRVQALDAALPFASS